MKINPFIIFLTIVLLLSFCAVCFPASPARALSLEWNVFDFFADILDFFFGFFSGPKKEEVAKVVLPISPPPPLQLFSGVTYYVDPSGSDQTGDGSQNRPWKTIQRAVETSQNGGTIIIRAGRYQEDISIINKNFILQGEGRGRTIIESTSAVTPTKIITSSDPLYPDEFEASGPANIHINGSLLVKLERLSFSGYPAQRGLGLFSEGANVEINECEFQCYRHAAIVIRNSASSTITNTNISDAPPGFGSVNSAADLGLTVINSFGTITGLTGGRNFDHVIDLYGNSDFRIENCTLEGSNSSNANGIRLNHQSTAQIIGNRIVGRRPSSLREGSPHSGILLNHNSAAEINNNLINGWQTGILFSSAASGRSKAYGNTISGNFYYGIATPVDAYAASGNPDLGGGNLSSPGQNLFEGNERYNIQNRNSQPVAAKNNFWGSTREEEIANTFQGEVDYRPFLTR